MKILMLGQNDPAGMMVAFANAINRYTEHSARAISMRTVYSLDFEYDIELPRLKEDFSEVEHLLKTSDIFHFHMLMDENYQLGPLEIRNYIKGKKLLYHHHGTYDHQMFLALADQYNEKYIKSKKRAIVATPDLLKLLPAATWQPNLVPIHNLDFLPRNDHLASSEEVHIAQAPTRKWHKHTKEFQAVCKRLEATYPNVRSHILEGKSYRECLKFKRGCHAVFDHMNGWFGISSLESLSHGIPTLAGLDKWCSSHIKDFTGAKTLPWRVVRDEVALEKELRSLIENPESRVEIGAESRLFMERYWTEQHALSVLLKTYESL